MAISPYFSQKNTSSDETPYLKAEYVQPLALINPEKAVGTTCPLYCFKLFVKRIAYKQFSSGYFKFTDVSCFETTQSKSQLIFAALRTGNKEINLFLLKDILST